MTPLKAQLARLIILGMAAVGYTFVDYTSAASADCQSCTGEDCNDVSGGATSCTETHGQPCKVSGEICNQT